MKLIFLVNQLKIDKNYPLEFFHPFVVLIFSGFLLDFGVNEFAHYEVGFVHVSNHVKHLDTEKFFIIFKPFQLGPNFKIYFESFFRRRQWWVVLAHQFEKCDIEQQKFGSIV